MYTLRDTIGCMVASLFTLSYIVAPAYVVAALIYCAIAPGILSFTFAAPLVLSAVCPIVKMPWLLKTWAFQCMLDYFDFETAFETSDDDLVARLEELKKEGRSMIFAGQPHGVLSFGGLCAGIAADSRFTDLVTAAAGAVLATPVVKHVVGIYGLIDASAKSLTRRLARGGAQGSVVLYTGGIAELFKTSDTEEILFINSRKGFIKLALRTGADIVPMYFFGNTSVLSVLKSSLLESLSRSYQISLTIFWGEFGLPIPRKHKLLYARGKPLGVPLIQEPTDEDVDKWHAKYVAEVRRIFDKNKHKVPLYKDKVLVTE